MIQIGLFSSLIFFIICFFGFFLNKEHHWKSLLIGSILALLFLFPEMMLIFLLLTFYVFYVGKSRFNLLFICCFPLCLMLAYKIFESDLFSFKSIIIQHHPSFDNIKWLGISFVSFNSISYLVDIERGIIKPTNSFFKLMLYLIYFPAIHSGPLHRFNYLVEQFENSRITEESLTNGLRLMLWGLFKNLIIAQRLFLLVNDLRSSEISGLWTLQIGFFFFLYVYFSFSSFIDFFQGLSEIFNIRLRNNFANRVYLAHHRHQFWRGWHITLSEWFRDYFFYRLMRNDFFRASPLLLVLITFMLIGLWHGLSWQYLLWGTFNGLWILTEKAFGIPQLIKKYNAIVLGRIYHLLIIMPISMIFAFPSLHDLWIKLISKNHFPAEIYSMHKRNLMIISALFIFVDIINVKAKDLRIDLFFASLLPFQRRLIYLFMICCIILLGFFSGGLNNHYIQY